MAARLSPPLALALCVLGAREPGEVPGLCTVSFPQGYSPHQDSEGLSGTPQWAEGQRLEPNRV